MSNRFDESVAKQIEQGNAFAKSDVRTPLNYKPLQKAKAQDVEVGGAGTVVQGQKMDAEVFNKGKLLLAMAKMILLKQALKVAEGDLEQSDKICLDMHETQEIVDKQIALSDCKGLVMEDDLMTTGVTPDYSFNSVSDATLKSQAVDAVNELIKSHGATKAGAVVEPKEKFGKKGLTGELPKEASKASTHRLGAFKSKEEDDMDKKNPSKIKGKKGQVAVATVSEKKVKLPCKCDATKKISGDKAIHLKGAGKLFIDNKYADKLIKPVPKGAKDMSMNKTGNVSSQGTNAKASGKKGLLADNKPIKKSIEEESEEFNKSMVESQNKLYRPTLAPKAKKKV